MKIIQKEDSHELLFSDEEIKIINKRKILFSHIKACRSLLML